VARLRVGDTWNFGDKEIGVLRRIIASQCVCRGVGHCNWIRGTVFCALESVCFYALEAVFFYVQEGVYGSTCLAVCLTVWAFQIENPRMDTNIMPF